MHISFDLVILIPEIFTYSHTCVQSQLYECIICSRAYNGKTEKKKKKSPNQFSLLHTHTHISSFLTRCQALCQMLFTCLFIYVYVRTHPCTEIHISRYIHTSKYPLRMTVFFIFIWMDLHNVTCQSLSIHCWEGKARLFFSAFLHEYQYGKYFNSLLWLGVLRYRCGLCHRISSQTQET